ncbi:MAG: dTDP-4-dehydrorhamnose 3,5-epimerase family protein [Oceanospirillaceae bacterium]|nr:dTDP-4-dehydrorhamnose 3,5-epimerase family protein [Colwellia sp.]NQZ32147.1 dTDP-4-dehydrorhamnose 3,5-epimerase family protein [Oceanospirillaceae bacterium]
MKIEELEIPDCFQITPNVLKDHRGAFTKTFHNDTFAEFGLNIEIKEEFYSISNKNVLRGLHFQKPPSAHNKLVYCAKGAVLDFFIDLRRGSPKYGQHLSIELNESNGLILYLPIGIAHGFLSLEDNSLMVYKTDCSYDSESDCGIGFSSCDIKLPIDALDIIMSKRDQKLCRLKEYQSEFVYE